MGFCGNCGQKTSAVEKFCVGCGTPIKEQKISVLEDTSQIIKEEYKQSTHPPEAEISRGSHIGDQKKRGEWLEYTTNHILQFAGFPTQRDVPFVFNDSTGDKFRIDVLASDKDIEIFVECKDYSDAKMSEKTMYTLTGQLDDYRKHQRKKVIGILAMTARDDGRNQGIRETLRGHDCFLWDGSFLEHLEHKIIEFGNKDDFRRYVLDHLDISESLTKKDKDEYYDFLIKYSFFTITPDEYVGKSFHVFNIIDDIKDKLPKGVTIINHKSKQIKNDKQIISYNVIIDFSFSLTMGEIKKFAEKRGNLDDRLRRRKPEEIVYKNYQKDMYELISEIYGVNFDPKSDSHYLNITFMGGRINQ